MKEIPPQGGKTIDLTDDEVTRLQEHDELLTTKINQLGFLRYDYLKKERELVAGFSVAENNLNSEVKRILKKNKLNGMVRPPIDYENKKMTVVPLPTQQPAPPTDTSKPPQTKEETIDEAMGKKEEEKK